MIKIIKKILSLLNSFFDKAEKEIISLFSPIVNFVRKNQKRWPIFKGQKLFFMIGTLFFLFSGVMLIWFVTLPLPDVGSFNDRILGESTKIYDRTGKILLYDVGKNMRRTVVPLNEISPFIKNATISIEDEDFYSHKGIKITSIVRAVFANILSLKWSQGGSTITQQVVKNSLLTRDKTIVRKIKEAFLAIKLERHASKDEILHLYLNESSYGGVIYGVEEASQAFFGKTAMNVSLSESAYLAALPQAPSYFSPYGKHLDELESRKNLVLEKMLELNYISKEDYTNAKNEKVRFAEQFSKGIKAPHFVMFVKNYLDEKYGEDVINRGGLKVITTLDYELQKKGEDIIKRNALENDKKYRATNAGLVAIDAPKGEILVMVGSRDYFDTEIPGNFNITLAKRQPGSSFKPFVYSVAFNKGYRPETVLFDVETQFNANCAPNDFEDKQECYSPKNYDGKFRGPINLRNSLAQSINLTAVKLLYLAGIKDSIDLAKKVGITTLTEPDRYGLSLVLGGGEVTLLEMTGAYSVFANAGEKVNVSPILLVEDRAKNILESHQTQKTRVMPKQTALLIADVLKDDNARAPIFGQHGNMYFADRDVAAKTGTTNNYRDAWIIGFSPNLAVGAWAGNNDNTPIDRKVAGFIVAPMWKEFMKEILKTVPDEKFEKPQQEDLSKLKPVLRGDVGYDNSGEIHTILYSVDKNDPLGAPPINPKNDQQFENWEYGVRTWAGFSGQTFNNTQGSAQSFSIQITSPASNSAISSKEKVFIQSKINSQEKISRVDYFINGIYLGSSSIQPYTVTFIPEDFGLTNNINIKSVAVTETGKNTEHTVSVKINP